MLKWELAIVRRMRDAVTLSEQLVPSTESAVANYVLQEPSAMATVDTARVTHEIDALMNQIIAIVQQHGPVTPGLSRMIGEYAEQLAANGYSPPQNRTQEETDDD